MANQRCRALAGILNGGAALLGATTLVACSAPLQRSAATAPLTVTRAASAVSPREAPLALTSNSAEHEPNEDCTHELFTRGVEFVPLRHSRGIKLPVQLGEQVAGVHYRPTVNFPLVVDCRFALVLSDMGRVLRRHQISTVEFSIAHAYRPTRAGNLSLHANGLALDIHRAVLDDGTELSVTGDYDRHLRARGCLSSAKALNQLACELTASGWFTEVLTPDDNADHRDHFHLGIPRHTRR
jgi:hypothetical protein